MAHGGDIHGYSNSCKHALALCLFPSSDLRVQISSRGVGLAAELWRKVVWHPLISSVPASVQVDDKGEAEKVRASLHSTPHISLPRYTVSLPIPTF